MWLLLVLVICLVFQVFDSFSVFEYSTTDSCATASLLMVRLILTFWMICCPYSKSQECDYSSFLHICIKHWAGLLLVCYFCTSFSYSIIIRRELIGECGLMFLIFFFFCSLAALCCCCLLDACFWFRAADLIARECFGNLIK